MKGRGLLTLLGVLGVAAVVAARSSRRSSSSSGRQAGASRYKGTYIGEFKTLHHKVSGEAYAVDDTTMFIERFTYDGEAPDAFFFAGNKTATPTSSGFIIPDERGTKQVLGPYSTKNIVLKFPITKKKGQRTLNDVQWVSVWCRRFAIDFGHVLIPPGLVKPKRQVATGLRSDKPLVSSFSVTIMDTNTIQLDDFTFDGTVQDAIFVMGSGDPGSSGVQVPNERSASTPLVKYTGRTVTLTLPPELRGEPLQYFGVWSPTKGMLASVTFDPDALIPPALSDLV